MGDQRRISRMVEQMAKNPADLVAMTQNLESQGPGPPFAFNENYATTMISSFDKGGHLNDFALSLVVLSSFVLAMISLKYFGKSLKSGWDLHEPMISEGEYLSDCK